MRGLVRELHHEMRVCVRVAIMAIAATEWESGGTSCYEGAGGHEKKEQHRERGHADRLADIGGHFLLVRTWTVMFFFFFFFGGAKN
jgi:hypothetical protein